MKNILQKSIWMVSSVTFGLGHIINLINGSGMGLAENLVQIFFAVLIGFLYVIIFRRVHASGRDPVRADGGVCRSIAKNFAERQSKLSAIKLK